MEEQGSIPALAPDPALGRHEMQQGSDIWANSDVIVGYQFCATMQLRTPLRVLTRHGERHPISAEDPPIIARSQWEGIWLFRAISFRELGIDIDDPPPSTMASSIGPIPSDGGDFLKFLIAVRRAAESEGSIEERRSRTSQILCQPKWSSFVAAHRSAEFILDGLFPPFVKTIRRMPTTVASYLRDHGYDSPARLDAIADSELLNIRGVGPSLLNNIRDAITNASNLDSRFVDDIVR